MLLFCNFKAVSPLTCKYYSCKYQLHQKRHNITKGHIVTKPQHSYSPPTLSCLYQKPKNKNILHLAPLLKELYAKSICTVRSFPIEHRTFFQLPHCGRLNKTICFGLLQKITNNQNLQNTHKYYISTRALVFRYENLR